MRIVVFTIALVFIGGLAVLTAVDIGQHGLTGISVISLVVLVIFGVGVLGALSQPPPK